jgi:hypothetical protein
MAPVSTNASGRYQCNALVFLPNHPGAEIARLGSDIDWTKLHGKHLLPEVGLVFGRKNKKPPSFPAWAVGRWALRYLEL